MSANKIIIGVLSGLAAGALLGVLFAPAKGSDTRKQIARTGKDLSNNVKEKYNDIVEMVSGPFMHSRHKVKENSNPGAVKAGAA